MVNEGNQEPVIDSEVCTGCTICVDECPTGALDMSESVATLANPDVCDGCGDCEEVCPVGCITLE